MFGFLPRYSPQCHVILVFSIKNENKVIPEWHLGGNLNIALEYYSSKLKIIITFFNLTYSCSVIYLCIKHKMIHISINYLFRICHSVAIHIYIILTNFWRRCVYFLSCLWTCSDEILNELNWNVIAVSYLRQETDVWSLYYCSYKTEINDVKKYNLKC